MLSSTKSRRILHFISVTLALIVFGYGLFLKYGQDDESAVKAVQKSELVKNVKTQGLEVEQESRLSDPD